MNILSRRSDSVLLWVALSLFVYVLLAVYFPLVPHYNRVPPADVRTFAPTLAEGLAYGLLVAFVFLLYLLAYRAPQAQRLGLAPILGITALLALPLLFVYPINATDVFRYFIRGRLTAVYGASPLAVAPDHFPGDPFIPLAGEWAAETSPYGPAWEIVAAGVAAVSGENLLLALLLFKGLALAAHLGSAALIWQQQPATELRAARTLLWAWNPALLLMFAVDAHNDSLMLFWLLLGSAFLPRRPVAGMLIALLGPLTKLAGLLPLPFLFIGAWQRQPGRGAKRLLLLGTAIGGALLVTVAFLPFGSPFALVERLASEATENVGYSPAATIWLVADQWGQPPSIDLLDRVGTMLFVALAGWLLWRTWRRREAVRGAADVFFAYLATSLTFRIWYTIWPFPWLLLERRPGGRLAAGLTFLVAAQLSVVIYGHLRVFSFDGNQTTAHVIGVLFVFVLPLLVAYVAGRSQRSGRRRR
jgi:hypothetical protein